MCVEEVHTTFFQEKKRENQWDKKKRSANALLKVLYNGWRY